MTKLEYPGFLLWWQDNNRFPLAVKESWRPWYLWPEDNPSAPDETAPAVPAMWLDDTPNSLHQE